MQYTSKFSGEEIDSILDNVGGKQDAIPDLETIRSNAKNASDTIARMVESGYLFAGIATIDTNPSTPDAKVFYIANGKGTYTNFGGLNVTEDEVVVLYWDTAWHKVATGIASQAKLSELEGKVDDLLPMSRLYKSFFPIIGETKAGVVYADSRYFTPNDSTGENLVFQVTAGVTYMISLTVARVGSSLGCVSFLSGGSYPTSNIYVDEIIKVCDALGAYETTYTPESNGYIIILQKYNNVIYSSSATVKSPQYIDFQAEINEIENKITEVENSLEDTEAEIFNTNYEREYNVTAGKEINTTGPNSRLVTDIKENQYFTVLLSSTEETKKCNLYFYKDSSNKYVTEEVQLGKEVLLSKDYKIIGIGFYIPSPTADGTVTLSVNAFSRISQVEKEVDTQKYYTQKLHLADAISAWANGEKFPIGWHGDSTTDGVSTTGWTTENSHPAQDEAAGGRGKADYICEKAYPYILEQMLKSEFNNENLRMYNIGYYGASLVNNYAQLEDIYSYAYSDVKMVGLSLSINDRGHYSTLSEFYRGVYDYLIKYVEFYRSKGIVPFMVLQQAVTQGGNNGAGAYKSLFQNYTQTIANKAKIEVAKLYGLEVIDMNSFGFTLLNASNYSHSDLTENLHFKDLGHKLEAEYLFSELVPWVEKTDERSEIYLGILSRCTKSDIALTGSTTTANPTSDKFKLELNFTKGDTSDKLIYEYYIFNNSGQYNLQYMTPEASGYIIHNGNRTEINSTEIDLGIVDVGLHKLQVYTGESNKVAFKGFKFKYL